MASEMGVLTEDEKRQTIPQVPLYPLRFEPIYQYRLWGGRHLADLLAAPLPSGPVGEAWILSDRDDHQSQVAEGPLKGQTIGQLLKQFPEQILGRLAHHFQRFPLLLKFLDVHEMLSVQVHPTKANKNLLPAGETAKTEAWVVLEVGPESRIYAGLKSKDNGCRSATGAKKRNGGESARRVHSEARRRNFPAGWDGSRSGRRHRRVRNSAEQRRDLPPV